VAASGVRAGVQDRGLSGQLTDGDGRSGAVACAGSAGEFRHEQPAGQGEHCRRAARVQGEADDPRARLAGPLPAGPLLRGQLLAVVAEEHAGVGDQGLLAGARIQRPQAADGIRAAA
jgi:hypothetical protein